MSLLVKIKICTYDIILTLYNLIAPSLKADAVVSTNLPGAGGHWPEYIGPQAGDSRCCCPALNALANHGILPRDGKNVKFKQIYQAVHDTYNFAPTFCEFVPRYAAKMLNKDYDSGMFDLAELDLHNGIEHDASITREDVAFQVDQSKPHLPFVEELLSSATGKYADGSPLLTISDVAKFSAKRRRDARNKNPDFSMATIHKIFGSNNSSTLLTAFGGLVKDLRPFLTEDRIPEGWQSRIRSRKGLTIVTFNATAVLPMEFMTASNEKKLAKSE